MIVLFFLRRRRPPRSTRTYTRLPYTTLVRSPVPKSYAQPTHSNRVNAAIRRRPSKTTEAYGKKAGRPAKAWKAGQQTAYSRLRPHNVLRPATKADKHLL